jgi:predicted DNA-binding transcriptional regulator AlpA
LEFLRFETPQQAFEQVVALATDELELDIPGAALLSTFAGPRHLARLLRHLADDLSSAGILGLTPPGGANPQFWSRWVRHRAKTKPVLWRNHRDALATGILETGRSAVLVLPTGAGKTTLSELKVAATLARGRKVLFLVPTLALVDQLRDELEDTFPKSLGDVEVSADGDLTALIVGPELQTIEVMTPERCLALPSHAADAIEEVGLNLPMLSKTSSPSGPPAPNRPVATPILLTPKQAARLLNLSVSWLAKRRLAGDGPPYVKLGGAVRYAEASLQQWMKGQQRTSTSGS